MTFPDFVRLRTIPRTDYAAAFTIMAILFGLWPVVLLVSIESRWRGSE